MASHGTGWLNLTPESQCDHYLLASNFDFSLLSFPIATEVPLSVCQPTLFTQQPLSSLTTELGFVHY